MKPLDEAFKTDETKSLKDLVKLNKKNLLKYIVMFTVVTLATLIIPTCGVLKSQAVSVGLLASTTFAIIDMNFPNTVYINQFHS